MRRAPNGLPWVLALTLLGVSCSQGLVVSGDSHREELAEIKARVLELQRQARVTEVELDRLRAQVAELEAGAQAATPQPTTAPVPEAALPAAPPPALADDDSELEASDLLEPELAAEPPAEEAAVEPAAEPIDAGTDPPAEVPSAAQALYDRGYTLFHQGRYLDAESSFQRFLQSYGETELADNAQYWIGESRAARGDLEGALAAFRETVERFPRGNKVPDALLKIADCLADLGDVEAARAAYAEVVRRFPNAAAAPVAEERSRRLE